MVNLCDKCHLPVQPKDNSVLFVAFMTRKPEIIMFVEPRHITCSPSRAQYIRYPGFPKIVDDRPEHDMRRLPFYKRWRVTIKYSITYALFIRSLTKRR